MKIEVTQEDIDRARYWTESDNPVTRAILRAYEIPDHLAKFSLNHGPFHANVSIEHGWLHYPPRDGDTRLRKVAIPDSVRAFCERRAPFEFELPE